MRDKKKLFDNLKYSVVMPIHRYNNYTGVAVQSVINAIGKRKDVEFIVLDDSGRSGGFTNNINHVKLPKMGLLNKLIIGTQLAKGKYYCNADYDDLAHPNKFELFDKLLKYNDIAGANNCVFWDTKSDKTYCFKNKMKLREHPYNGRIIEYPWLQHSNSAIPLDWLRRVSYDGGLKVQMAHKKGKEITDSPIWVRAVMDALKIGFIDDWKQCWQIVHGDNVNTYTKEQWIDGFDEIQVKKHKVLL